MRREPDWRGLAAVLTVVGVFAVLIIGAIYAGRNPSYTISSEEIATVATVLGAAIGALAGYMAGTRKPPPRNGPPAPPESAEPGDGDPPGMSGPGGNDAA